MALNASSHEVMGSPIPVSDIEAVLSWVDTQKLSRPTKKINRDFSDAVLLAEILLQHYPKLVEMHNYPPRNSFALKLNNWSTLNRKVLKKLKLSLCSKTMEQLANCTPGVIERVLIQVRDKIKHDEDLMNSTKDTDQNMSSGGSYYEACEEDDNVLVIPLKTRVNGTLEVVQQKVVSYDSYCVLKQELKDAKETIDVIKQKVDHFENLLKVKDERIEELYRQLERKQSRRNVTETISSTANETLIAVPLEDSPPTPKVEAPMYKALRKTQSLKLVDLNTKTNSEDYKRETSSCRITPKPSMTEVVKGDSDSDSKSVDIVKSDVFKEASEEVAPMSLGHSSSVFRDDDPCKLVSLTDTFDNERTDIVKPNYPEAVNCI